MSERRTVAEKARRWRSSEEPVVRAVWSSRRDDYGMRHSRSERAVHNGGTEPTGGRTEKRMWFDSAGWGVTPAAAGVRVARGGTGASGPRPPPTCARRAPRHSTALRAVTPAGAASSPFRLRSLRSSVVSSGGFAPSCSRPPQLSAVDLTMTGIGGSLTAEQDARCRLDLCESGRLDRVVTKESHASRRSRALPTAAGVT